jgi:hypothetical protein
MVAASYGSLGDGRAPVLSLEEGGAIRGLSHSSLPSSSSAWARRGRVHVGLLLVLSAMVGGIVVIDPVGWLGGARFPGSEEAQQELVTGCFQTVSCS